MNHLLDVNVLLAAIWENHPQNARAFDWLDGKSVTVCPLVELGFLRISTQPKAFNAPMEKARDLLAAFLAERGAARIADDLPALDASAKKSNQITDGYLAALAAHHGLKLATFDAGIKHPAAIVVT